MSGCAIGAGGGGGDHSAVGAVGVDVGTGQTRSTTDVADVSAG